MQRAVGNSAVSRLISGATGVPLGTVPWPEAAGIPPVQRRRLGSVVDEDDNAISVRTRTIAGWRTFLSGADEWVAAIELNAFMARAVDHDHYERGPAEEQARHLARLQAPSTAEQRDLAVAMLTTRSDLREIGDASPVTGLLLPRFLRATYQAAAAYIAEQAGQPGRAGEWQVNPDVIDAFLGEAEDTFADLQSLAPRVQYGGGYAFVDPNRLGEVGATSVGTGPTKELEANALAGAQAAAAAAFGDVVRNPQAVGSIRDEGARQVRTHAQVLAGIIARQNRIDELNAALLDAAVGIAFAGAGPLVGKLRLFGEAITQAGTAAEGVGGEAFRSAAMEGVKAATSATAGALAGRSGAELRRSARSAFSVGLQEHVNRISSAQEAVPNAVMDVKGSLEAQFHFATD